ncbi:tRNA1(Val) (adenine(37)-N6)-methyltransferase [Campylobacter coli]|uniref:tRNA1(Val) (adenine(37)-N6)-methyltransferase n=1 Tax=Campylobacter coli TaxID=195 RepID=UPI00092EA631|nr:methyltransferase [Campylobacter coli]HEB7552626.1 methyltransferase [Campylobacter coli]
MQDSIKLAQLSDGYRYNSDSLLLADFVLEMGIKNQVLEVGSGCGIIGILLKKFVSNLDLSLLDIQQENIELIHRNLKQNNIQAEVLHEDFRNFQNDKKFDFIVCNPPFYRDGTHEGKNTHKNISKFQKYLTLDEFIARSNALLKPMGVLYFCYEALALDKICLILESKKLKLTKIRFVHTHQNISARLVLVQARKSVKSPCEILPPFFIYKNENLSEQMQEIHSRFRLESYDI